VIDAGLRNWQLVEVREGLSEGDRVVTSRNSTDVKAGVEAVALFRELAGDGPGGGGFKASLRSHGRVDVEAARPGDEARDRFAQRLALSAPRQT